MEGVIDHTVRDLLTELGGIDRCVTEFLRVSHALLPPQCFLPHLCPNCVAPGRTTSKACPSTCRLLGGRGRRSSRRTARAAAELGAPGIDLNFGCPAKTVNRSDGGSIILREPQRVQRHRRRQRAVALPADRAPDA
jgi:tRNA-dihydrouridine synthase C